MRTFIAADILGLSPALRQLFAPLGDALVFLSPWDGEGCPYASEAEAARVFHAEDGLARYAARIARAVQGEAAFCVGLSVGATSLWHYLASADCSHASQAVLYYGSRIRDHRGLHPRGTAELVFAAREASFEPQALAAELRARVSACSVVPDTAHGFMNPASPHFLPAVAAAEVERLRRRLDALRALPDAPPCPDAVRRARP